MKNEVILAYDDVVDVTETGRLEFLLKKRPDLMILLPILVVFVYNLVTKLQNLVTLPLRDGGHRTN